MANHLNKSVLVTEETWALLTKMRVDYRFKNIDELISILLRNFKVDLLKQKKEKKEDDTNPKHN